MKKNPFYILGGIGMLFLIGGFVFSKKFFLKTEKIHYHAGFVVFENNQKIDFSDNKYMFIKPCTVDGKEEENSGNKQMEKAHLHDNFGDLIHVEAEGAIWRDLFININFPVDYSKVTAYINGIQVSNFESQVIFPDDSLVLFIGDNDKSLFSQAVTKEYIESQAKKSAGCGD